MNSVYLSPRPAGQFAVVKIEDGCEHVMGTGGYREEALFPSRRAAWAAVRKREQVGVSSWIKQDPFAGLPTVATGRPGSMFGGMKTAGGVGSAQPYPETPRVTVGNYEDWRDTLDADEALRCTYLRPPKVYRVAVDVEAADGFSDMPLASLLLAWRAAADGLTDTVPNEEALLSGVPVVAFQ